MGSAIPAPEQGSLSEELFVHVIAAAPLERLEMIRSGELVDAEELEGVLEATLQRPVNELRSGEYVYVRVVQEDGGMAWSSPIFIE